MKLAAVGLSITQLRKAIEANNRNDGAGRLNEGDEVLLVRSEGSIRTMEDLRAIVVKAAGRRRACALPTLPRCAGLSHALRRGDAKR